MVDFGWRERAGGCYGTEFQRSDAGALVTALAGIGKCGSRQGGRPRAAASGWRAALRSRPATSSPSITCPATTSPLSGPQSGPEARACCSCRPTAQISIRSGKSSPNRNTCSEMPRNDACSGMILAIDSQQLLVVGRHALPRPQIGEALPTREQINWFDVIHNNPHSLMVDRRVFGWSDHHGTGSDCDKSDEQPRQTLEADE